MEAVQAGLVPGVESAVWAEEHHIRWRVFEEDHGCGAIGGATDGIADGAYMNCQCTGVPPRYVDLEAYLNHVYEFEHCLVHRHAFPSFLDRTKRLGSLRL